MSRPRAVVAMSGGVDSSMAAAMTIEAGYEVVGMTMKLADHAGDDQRGRGGTCCSPAEVDLARRVCESLGIPHYTVDERERFRRHVIDDFAREYAAGRTPNPCARCNQHVKFGPLLERAAALGAEVLVTGHYARIRDGQLLRGRDPAKDQSYFLFAMGRETLSKVSFPLGELSKEEVRDRARAMGFPNADAPDSQELCFVPGGDTGAVVERHGARLGLDAEAFAPGEIRDESGRVLGQHRGVHRLTVGQRRGIGVASDKPRYVLRVIPSERAVVVGDARALERREVEVEGFRAMADLEEGSAFEAHVQIRHRSPAAPARVTVNGETARVEFDEPVRAVAPGQAAVVYRGEVMLGGGWMASS